MKEYANINDFWADIVTKLSSNIEFEFGKVTSRLLRLFKVEYFSSHVSCNGGWFRRCMKHPKTLCHLPKLFWFTLCVISLISLPFFIDEVIFFINGDRKQVRPHTLCPYKKIRSVYKLLFFY